MKVVDGAVTLYRFHPTTNADAEELEPEEFATLSEHERNELAKMRREGAKFFWCENEDGSFSRVEKANIAFVVNVSGLTLKVQHGEKA